MARGHTLVELVTVMAIAALLAGVGLRWLTAGRDARRVRRASAELVAFYRSARLAGMAAGRPVRVEFSVGRLTALFEGSPDSVFQELPGPGAYGVMLRSDRPLVRLWPTGLGRGAANTTIVLERGAVSDTIRTSRLGRVRRSGVRTVDASE